MCFLLFHFFKSFFRVFSCCCCLFFLGGESFRVLFLGVFMGFFLCYVLLLLSFFFLFFFGGGDLGFNMLIYPLLLAMFIIHLSEKYDLAKRCQYYQFRINPL